MMGTIVKLVQGSAEWHAHRAQYRNASETGIVMGASPWQTPYQLWELRTGRRQPEVNAAMVRGTTLEPVARAAYEALTGHVMQPVVLVEGDYSASLDGLTFDGELLLEIKCPVKGKNSTLWRDVTNGQVPLHYSWQLEHQFLVSKACKGHLYVFDGSEGLLLEVEPQRERWQAIHEAWEIFMRCIETDTPPALTERDKVVRGDEAWQQAASDYLAIKGQADTIAQQLEKAKQRLIGLASHPSESGFGVAVSRFWKQGAVDYKRIPEICGLDLEPYRKKGGFETRISTAK